MTKATTLTTKPMKKVRARFYETAAGNVPVIEFILALSDEDRKVIGRDIATVEFGWPIGMPTCRPLSGGLYEIRSSISSGRISRLLFSIVDSEIFIVHGFIKKTRKIPNEDIALARKRLGEAL